MACEPFRRAWRHVLAAVSALASLFCGAPSSVKLPVLVDDARSSDGFDDSQPVQAEGHARRALPPTVGACSSAVAPAAAPADAHALAWQAPGSALRKESSRCSSPLPLWAPLLPAEAGSAIADVRGAQPAAEVALGEIALEIEEPPRAIPARADAAPEADQLGRKRAGPSGAPTLDATRRTAADVAAAGAESCSVPLAAAASFPTATGAHALPATLATAEPLCRTPAPEAGSVLVALPLSVELFVSASPPDQTASEAVAAVTPHQASAPAAPAFAPLPACSLLAEPHPAAAAVRDAPATAAPREAEGGGGGEAKRARLSIAPAPTLATSAAPTAADALPVDALPARARPVASDPTPALALLGVGERLVWSDEFEYEGLPREDRWDFQTDANSWVHQPSHNELQWYTSKREANAWVSGGCLRITARREENEGGCAFTSARLRTKGRGDWQYGRIEVCAKLPPARRGLWPAIWLVSSDNRYGRWPASGEIDIVENLGCEPGVLHGSVHTGAYNHRYKSHRTAVTTRADAHDRFHIYALHWTEAELALLVDGEVFFTFSNERLHARKGTASAASHGGGGEAGAAAGVGEWPFDHPFHLILNVAVGGNWGGKDGIADDVCPAQMEIAYVRVFR